MESADRLLTLLTEEFPPAFLIFALHRTPGRDTAEELVQEIACQAVSAIRRGAEIRDPASYFWSVAHNTYKRWLASHRRETACVSSEDINVVIARGDRRCPSPSPAEQAEQQEDAAVLRREIARLSGEYRRTIVSVYYEGRSLAETAETLGLSEDMVKYYLRSGKKQIQEGLTMTQETAYTARSFAPPVFSIYYGGIDYSSVNIWRLFSHKLPAALAVAAYEKPVTVRELSMDTGVPAVYVEEELAPLREAGLLRERSRGKFQTNFAILAEPDCRALEARLRDLMDGHAERAAARYPAAKEVLRSCGVFPYDADEAHWQWAFRNLTAAFDDRILSLTDADYPVLLAEGARAFIYAVLGPAGAEEWGDGHSGIEAGDCRLYPCDVAAFGPYHRQDELCRDREKAQALVEFCLGKPAKPELVARLTEEGYVRREGGRPVCDVMFLGRRSREAMAAVNKELLAALSAPCRELAGWLTNRLKKTLPAPLRPHAAGFAACYLGTAAGRFFSEALHRRGLLPLPAEGDLSPYACWIESSVLD